MEEMQIQVLSEQAIMKRAQKSRGVTQDVIADRLGIKRNSLCQNINRKRMSLSVFSSFLNALDYDVVIVDRDTGEKLWKLYVEQEEDDI